MSTLSPTTTGFDHWLQDINRICGCFHAEPQQAGFLGSIAPFQSGNLKFSQVQASQARLYRTSADLDDRGDHYFMVFQQQGSASLQQQGHSSSLAAGDISLIDSRYPCDIRFGQGSQQISLILPHEVVARNLRTRELPMARRLSARTPVARLATALMKELSTTERLSLAEGDAFLDAISSLLAPLNHNRDTDEPQRPQRQLQRLMDFIDAHIADPTLSPETIAAAANCSQRTLYRLFAEHGGVQAYLRNRRLDLCASQLRTLPIIEKTSAVGYNFGFVDSSHFCTRFRQRYGMTPTAYRKMYGGR